MLKEAKRHTVFRLLKSVPGIGPIRTAYLIAFVATPWRFPTKQAFLAYCGLSVRSRSSGNYKVAKGELVWRPRSVQTLGLTKKRNAFLKSVFKSAATTACHHEEVRIYKQRLLDRGLSEKIARVMVARKLAVIAPTVWKKGEKYDPSRVSGEMSA